MKRITLAVLVLFALTACQQDPYKGKGQLQNPEAPKNKPIEAPKPEGALGLVVPKTMIFVEGSKGEYDVKAAVPNNGVMKVEFAGLPTGMTFNASTMKLEWTPTYQDANDPNDPTILMKTYLVVGKVYDQRNPAEALTTEAQVVVRDTPRPAAVKSTLEMLGIEGSPIAHVLEFEDLEYPVGPFSASISGLPLDVVIDWPNNTMPRFVVRWTPQYDKVTNKPQERYVGNVIIYNPRGKRLDFNIVWTVANRVVGPVIAGPAEITQPADIDFMVMAEDLNGEYIPQWTAIHPGAGNLTVVTQAIVGPGRPKSMGHVSWKNIPADKIGVSTTLNLRACVQSSNCSSHSVRVLPTAVAPTGANR